MIEFPENEDVRPARDRELERLLMALIDDEITEGQAERLRERLREDPAARAAYIDALAFEALLREEFPARTEMDVDLPLAVPAPARRWGLPWFATGVAAALLVGLFGFLLTSNRPGPAGALALTASPDGTALARVTRVGEGAVDGTRQAFVPGAILEVGELEVDGGLVEITFNCGAVVTLEPGARISLEGETQAYLHEGKVSATVPEQAVGFSISTPRSKIFDLGTSFDLAVAENGDTELHVLDGLVETILPAEDEDQVRLVREHEGIRIASSGIERANLSWPYAATEIAGPGWNPLGTYVHWSLDQPVGDHFPAHAGQHRLALLNGKGPVEDLPAKNVVPGAFGSALRLDGRTETARCATLQASAGDAPRTVACWVKIPANAGADHPNGIIAWGGHDSAGARWLTNWNTRERDGTVGALRQEVGGGYVVGSTDLRDGRWHHVAAVFLGGKGTDVTTHVKLYVDGRLEAVSGSRQASIEDADSGSEPGGPVNLVLGGYPDPSRNWTLNGSLDEVYVFDGALTPSQIMWLMAHNYIWLPTEEMQVSL
jgi:ferric-dicitrate binding protein FerR (iron transport regulator)